MSQTREDKRTPAGVRGTRKEGELRDARYARRGNERGRDAAAKLNRRHKRWLASALRGELPPSQRFRNGRSQLIE
jgi:hypothetical protein